MDHFDMDRFDMDRFEDITNGDLNDVVKPVLRSPSRWIIQPVITTFTVGNQCAETVFCHTVNDVPHKSVHTQCLVCHHGSQPSVPSLPYHEERFHDPTTVHHRVRVHAAHRWRV